MQCDYFDAGVCRSCTRMGTPYERQLDDKQAGVAATLAGVVPAGAWAPAQASPESGFRNKAKLAVGGRPGEVTLGILDGDRRGVDLRHCGLHEPALHAALPLLADAVDDLRLEPYDVPTRRGELKYLLVTRSPDGELMLRVVLRTDRDLERVRAAVPVLRERLPHLRVVTVNLHPEHKAVLEGDTEVVLTEGPQGADLPMRLAGLTLHLPPRSFFQTNTAVGAALYEQARAWVDEASPREVLDLYCGVGGFALAAATATRAPEVVRGVEVSAEAVDGARRSAAELGLPRIRFEAGDVDVADPDLLGDADLVVVNPPRRGIGALAPAIERSGVRHVVYSSCQAASLARDLAAMPSYGVRAARLFDMFPQTGHHEVAVRLERERA
ncbi:methyltransferase domain-containing protein [Lapillicoccus jejuensis]|uniref:23S rRNA m(5)U-747 methyltransferase n=1 Tax=Lapillicoccus jejuensis TaxID=402171 RepID=A0A542E4X6_9MICO|nr:methyltransferase domain-containing protein [Lapillicoccus jejuensis]TQJ10390.1 23S rRNA m(5)U-747 methyltransferase [Lapillicoccus jejuensis]